jgi:hypothetical protein
VTSRGSRGGIVACPASSIVLDAASTSDVVIARDSQATVGGQLLIPRDACIRQQKQLSKEAFENMKCCYRDECRGTRQLWY